MWQMDVDEIEVLRREIYRRVVTAGIFESGQIQLDNEKAPDVLPYCRITIAASGKYEFQTQRVMGQTVIAEFDIFGSALSDTRNLTPKAAAIEREFGKYDRGSAKRAIAMTNFTGASATVAEYGRGTEHAESGTGLYRIPVLIYVKIELESGAEYKDK